MEADVLQLPYQHGLVDLHTGGTRRGFTNVGVIWKHQGKTQLEDLIKKLDSLSEKNLNRVISVVDPLIENFLSGEDFRTEIKSESHPVE